MRILLHVFSLAVVYTTLLGCTEAEPVLAGFAMSANQDVVNKSKRMLVDYIHNII